MKHLNSTEQYNKSMSSGQTRNERKNSELYEFKSMRLCVTIYLKITKICKVSQ